MAGGYVVPSADAFDALNRRLREAEDQIRELQRPTGTQRANSVANMVDADVALGAQASFALDGTLTEQGQVEILTPAGFSSALVVCVGHLNVQNSSGAQRTIEAWAGIHPGGFANPGRATVPNNAFGTVSSEWSKVIEGLAEGDPITCDLHVKSDSAMGASASNQASVAVSVVFLR